MQHNKWAAHAAVVILLFAAAAFGAGQVSVMDPITKLPKYLKGGEGISINGASGTITATGTAVISNSIPFPNISTGLKGKIRDRLTTNRTYYISTTGNDSNTGLSAGSAFLTLQHAIDVASNLDLGSYNAILQLADGTYDYSALNRVAVNRTTAATSWQHTASQGTIQGYIIIQGNAAAPRNVDLIATISASGGTSVIVKDLKLRQTAANAYHLLFAQTFSYLGFSNVVFGSLANTGPLAAHIRAEAGGFIGCLGDYAIDAGTTSHIYANVGGMLWTVGKTITLNGTPNFSGAFATLKSNGNIYIEGNTYVGSATGKKYDVASGGAIQGNDAANLPGNTAGVMASAGSVEGAEIYELSANKGTANGYAPLDASVLIPTANVPDLPESKITNLVTDLAAKEATANKGAADGYAPLDSSSLVPLANIPAALTGKNAATATALASTPTKCTAGNYPLGVDALGNAQNCTAATSGTVTSVGSADANATVANGTTTPVITVVSAPKLQTARAINGVDFDGTAPITINAVDSTARVAQTQTINGVPYGAGDITINAVDSTPRVAQTTTVNGHPLSSNVTVTAGDLSLGNVDNTSDATKNAAVATLTNKTLTSPIIDKIKPVSDTVTALQVTKADGSTVVLNVDTTNARLGVGTTSPQAALDLRLAGTGEMWVSNTNTPASNAGGGVFIQSLGGPGPIVSGNRLGFLTFGGDLNGVGASTGIGYGAAISAFSSGTWAVPNSACTASGFAGTLATACCTGPGTGSCVANIPAEIRFETAANGSGTATRTVRLKVTDSGRILAGPTLPTDDGVTAFQVNGAVSASAFASTVATGTAPFTVASTTAVSNLNASLLGGKTFADPGAIGSTTPSTGAFTNLSVSGTLNNPSGVQTTSTTIDTAANQGATISSSGATTLTITNVVSGRYFDFKVTSSGGGALSFVTLTPTWVTGTPASIAAGKSSWFVCKGTGANTADCAAIKENY